MTKAICLDISCPSIGEETRKDLRKRLGEPRFSGSIALGGDHEGRIESLQGVNR